MVRSGIVSLILLVSACSQPGDGASRVAGAASGEPLEARHRSPDLERGELLALACRACHTLGEGEDHLLGPNLYGLFGRRTGSAAGFEYSAALQGADFVWTPDALDAWLAEPASYLPGNDMAFAGFDSASDRSDLVAYLLRVTADGS